MSAANFLPCFNETESFEGLPRGEWSTFKRTPRPLPQKKKPASRKKPAKLSPAALDRARARARQRRAALRAALTPEEKRLVHKVLREREDEVIRKMRERAKR